MILDSLRNSASFNETDRAIATYLINHTGDLKTLTMAKLAQETYTSNATIIRFCKKLGLSGYRELIMQLIQEISGDYLLAATVDRNRPFDSSDSIEAIEGNLANLLKDIIDQTKIELDIAKLGTIAKAVLSAPRIYIFAKGESYLAGCIFRNNLLKLDRHVTMADDGGLQTLHVKNGKPGDLYLFLSYSGIHYDYSKYAATLSERGIKPCLITAFSDSALAKQCDTALLIPKSERVIGKVANYSSMISLTYTLQVIYSLIFNQDYQENYRVKREADSFIFTSFAEI